MKIPYIIIDEWKKYNVIAGVTTRNGGYSKGVYSSLNMGRDTEDDKESLMKNISRWLDDFNWKNLYDNNRVFFTDQIHSDGIKIVDENTVQYNSSDGHYYNIDGFITHLNGQNKVALTVITADCQSIFIFDTKTRASGMLHAGWRGTKLKILEKALNLMNKIYASNPNDILIYLGPCIRQHNYEVSPDFQNHFKRNLVKKDGKFLFDISNENKDIAIDFGVPERNIMDSNLCSFDNEELFFSHRRDKIVTGRMLSFICVD